MNQAEKRRQRLLEYTRNLYTDRRTVPAIHPRYKAAYYQVYPENTRLTKSTLGVRIVISAALFAAYITMKQNGMMVLGMDTLQILETILYNYRI